ncbi:hypothetical protein [Streptomyces sp. NPDC093111]|uniref:hypothetical protein n=1 Tax=Streptomyces sp. NPDC093111 TaxID=3154978 RepID=UPI00342C0D83
MGASCGAAGRPPAFDKEPTYRRYNEVDRAIDLVEALPDPEVPAPRVVSVDEYATRTGRHHWTVLVDVESRRPIDLLPDQGGASSLPLGS